MKTAPILLLLVLFAADALAGGRRVRHVNGRDAGSVLSLDARRLQGLADSDPIATWPDLSRNAANLTQTTPADRPLFKANIQGGQPGVFSTQAEHHEVPLRVGRTFIVALQHTQVTGHAEPTFLFGQSTLYDWHGSDGSSPYLFDGTYANGSIREGQGWVNGSQAGLTDGKAGYIQRSTAAQIVAFETLANVFFDAVSGDRNGQFGARGMLGHYFRIEVLPTVNAAMRLRLEQAMGWSYRIPWSR